TGSVAFTVDLTRDGGFSGAVDMSVQSPPAGVTARFDDPILNGLGGIATTLTLDVAVDAESGDHDITILATPGPAPAGGATPAPVEVHVTLIIDHDGPIIEGPWASYEMGGTLSSGSAPLRLSWDGSDAGSGLNEYRLLYAKNGAQWLTVVLSDPLATTAVRTIQFNGQYDFLVHATDRAGNESDAHLAPAQRLPVSRITQSTDTGVAVSPGWTVGSTTDASGYSLHRSKIAGSSISYTFVGMAIGWVAPVGPSKGTAKVFVDGESQGVISLVATAKHDRRVVFSKGWTTMGTHTIRIIVRGGASAKQVGVDAFVFLGD
ncbi:MAG: hypothetical protein ABIZ34_04760, partial [Candidatus Limnocylindrales bacterium]